MSRIRILRVITRLNVGGPAIQACLLTARLDPSRFESMLVAGTEGPAEENLLRLRRAEACGDPMIVPSLGRRVAPLDDLRALGSVVSIARKFRPHIVHTHLAKAGFIGRVAARLTGRPAVVHTYHGSVFHGYFGPRETALYVGIERALARISTRIVAITPGQREELERLGIAPAHKIVEIALGFDLAPFAAGPDRLQARELLGFPAQAPVVGIVARLVPIKDVGTFLRSVAILKSSVPDLHALVVGDGEERGALQTMATQLGISARCHFVGWRADMPTVYAAMDVLALSSLNEGSPVSVIEAMAAERAVVATRVGGVPDVVMDGATGTLVPPRNPAQMAEAVRSLLIDERRRVAFGLAGRARATALFGADRLVEQIQGLYAELTA